MNAFFPPSPQEALWYISKPMETLPPQSLRMYSHKAKFMGRHGVTWGRHVGPINLALLVVCIPYSFLDTVSLVAFVP